MSRQAILILVLLLVASSALAANNPGHDGLYIEETGNSTLTGNLNVSNDLRIAQRMYSSYLDIRGDGTLTGNNRVIGSNGYLQIESSGVLYLNKDISGGEVRVGTASLPTILNVSGTVYQGNVRLCLENGTNCPSSLGSANITGSGAANKLAYWTSATNVASLTGTNNGAIYYSGAGAVQSGTLPVASGGTGTTTSTGTGSVTLNNSPVITSPAIVGTGSITASSGAFTTLTRGGQNVCTADGTNCPSVGGASSAGGWTNTSSTTSTALTMNVNNNAVLFNGTTGNTPASGAGTRMMWIPAKSALRAGNVTGDQWDDANIGLNSVALGYNNKATGTNTFAAGYGNNITNSYSFALGQTNQLSHWYDVAIGNENIISSPNSLAVGNYNTVSTNGYNLAVGNLNTVTGGISYAIGGWSTASGSSSTTLGNYLTASATNAVIIGNGIENTNRGVNNIANSIMFVANSTTPTMFINGSAVGVGTTAPADTLTVNGTLNATNIQLAANCNDGQVLKWSGGVGTCGTDSNSGSGTVNSGVANKIAYYTGAGTTVDDLAGTNNGAIYYDGSGNVQSGTLPVASGGTGTTTSTGSGSVVLSASPTLTGTLSATNVTASGNVGIGSGGAPTAPLEVFHGGAAGYGTAVRLYQNAIGNSDGPKIAFYKTMTASKGWTAGMINGVNAGDFVISEDGGTGGFGTPRFQIAPGGNIGIGDSSPASKLSVTGNISASGKIYAEGSQVCTAANGLCITGSSSAAGWTNTSAQTTTTLRVGVNSASPTSAFEVGGAADGTPDAAGVHLGTSGNYGSIELAGSSGGFIDFTTTGTDLKGRVLYDHGSNFMALYTNTTERLRIDSSGNVGIGTTPSYKLHVVNSGTGATITVDGSGSSDMLSLEPQATFHRIAYSKLHLWDWETSADTVVFDGGDIALANDIGAQLLLGRNDNVHEGGEIVFTGAASYDGWYLDTYDNNMRAFTGSANTNTFQIMNTGAGVANLNVEGSVTAASFSGSGSGLTGTAASLTAGAASALAADGSNCGAGQYAQGVDASGNAQGCAAPSVSNADTVDNLHASSFLRSDTSSTLTSGTLTFGTGTGFDTATNDIYANMRVIRNTKASSDGMYLGYGNTNSGATRIYSAGSTNGHYYSDVSGNILRSDGATYWHSANDGSGSGLDADTLDGAQPSGLTVGNSNACSADGACEAQSLTMSPSSVLSHNWFEFGPNDGATGVGIDMHGGSSYSDYAARIYRVGGDNSALHIYNRGTGGLYIINPENAAINFQTSNTNRLSILGTGEITTSSRIVLPSSNDGRTNGLWFWGNADSNWVAYMAQPTVGINPAGGTMTAGYWNNGHTIRFRSGNGISVERYNDGVLTLDMDNEGNIYHRGQVRAASFYPGNQATDYWGHDGGGITKYGTGYTYLSSGTLYVQGSIQARGGIANDGGDLAINDGVAVSGYPDFNYGEIEIQGTQSSKAPFVRFHRPSEEFGQIRYGTDATHDGRFYLRNMNAGTRAKINVDTPTDNNDAATKAYVDNYVYIVVPQAGGCTWNGEEGSWNYNYPGDWCPTGWTSQTSWTTGSAGGSTSCSAWRFSLCKKN